MSFYFNVERNHTTIKFKINIYGVGKVNSRNFVFITRK